MRTSPRRSVDAGYGITLKGDIDSFGDDKYESAGHAGATYQILSVERSNILSSICKYVLGTENICTTSSALQLCKFALSERQQKSRHIAFPIGTSQSLIPTQPPQAD